MADLVLRRGDRVHAVAEARFEGATVVHHAGACIVVRHGDRIVRGAVERDGDRVRVHCGGLVWEFGVGAADGRAAASASAASSEVVAPMTGRVVSVLVADGDRVPSGAPLVVVEAMKMEHKVTAPKAAAVGRVHVAVGAQVDVGALLVSLRFEDAP